MDCLPSTTITQFGMIYLGLNFLPACLTACTAGALQWQLPFPALSSLTVACGTWMSMKIINVWEVDSHIYSDMGNTFFFTISNLIWLLCQCAAAQLEEGSLMLLAGIQRGTNDPSGLGWHPLHLPAQTIWGLPTLHNWTVSGYIKHVCASKTNFHAVLQSGCSQYIYTNIPQLFQIWQFSSFDVYI